MHEAPTDAIFNEMKLAAMSIWNTCDNKYGYADEKISQVKAVNNIQDNAMTFYRMFDFSNQTKMRAILSEGAINYIKNNR